MKLRNKKTGEIGELQITEKHCSVVIENCSASCEIEIYSSLKELNDNWEYYEEMKGYWFINEFGTPTEITHTKENIYDKSRKNFGNCFETKEEAEKTVEKLKAWKRLKDKGFDIESWAIDIGDNYYKTGQIMLNLNNVRNREWDEYEQIMEIENELNILFGEKQ